MTSFSRFSPILLTGYRPQERTPTTFPGNFVLWLFVYLEARASDGECSTQLVNDLPWIRTSAFVVVDIAGVELPDVKSYLILVEGTLSHIRRRIEKDYVVEALPARVTVGVHLVEVSLRETRVSFLGV